MSSLNGVLPTFSLNQEHSSVLISCQLMHFYVEGLDEHHNLLTGRAMLLSTAVTRITHVKPRLVFNRRKWKFWECIETLIHIKHGMYDVSYWHLGSRDCTRGTISCFIIPLKYCTGLSLTFSITKTASPPYRRWVAVGHWRIRKFIVCVFRYLFCELILI